jgi:2-haloacid dehalogenase
VTAARTVDAVFFDLFGTLLSLAPLGETCDRLSVGRGAEIAARWRVRQLEATWLRTAMQQWADFDVVTLDALRGTLQEFGVDGAEESAVRDVADAFDDLPLVDGAREVVHSLSAASLATGILTNASSRTLVRVRERIPPMDHYLSVDAARHFKPHPSVYQLAVDATGFPPGRVGFVTSNGWDAAGGGTFGLRVAWLRPGPTASLPAVGAPEPIVATWPELVAIFTS